MDSFRHHTSLPAKLFFIPLILTVFLSSTATALPQDLQEGHTEEAPTTEGILLLHDSVDGDLGEVDIDDDEDDVEEQDLLQDQMDKYADVPYIIGDNTNCKCGIPPARLIAGGENAEISQYPWITLLKSVESFKLKIPYCGGALINNQYVLTASHCVDGMDPKKIEVVLREQNVSMSAEDEYMFTRKMAIGRGARSTMSAISIQVDKVIQHPMYSRKTLDNDIALIRLKVRVPLEGFDIVPICVPRETATFSQGVYATVAGYGATSEAKTSGLTLQMATVRLLSNELCNTPAFHANKITPNMVCADGNGKGPCAGDTGGPLMIRTSKDDTDSRQVLAGLASWSSTCLDPLRPAVYTRVPMYEKWILENTQDASYCSDGN